MLEPTLKMQCPACGGADIKAVEWVHAQPMARIDHKDGRQCWIDRRTGRPPTDSPRTRSESDRSKA